MLISRCAGLPIHNNLLPDIDFPARVVDRIDRIIQTVSVYAMNEYQLNKKTARNIGIGAVSLLSNLFIQMFTEVIKSAMERLVGPQAFNPVNNKVFIKSMGNPVFCACIIAKTIFIGVVLEEIAFRGCCQDQMRLFFDKLSIPPFLRTLLTVTTTAAVFALIHLSPFHNITTNTVLIACIFLSGLVDSAMKELTGDLWASTTGHILNNSIAVYQIWKAIKG